MVLSLQEISDRLEIQELLTRYCYALDDHDWDTFREVFMPDAIIDYRKSGGPRAGVEEQVIFLDQALSKTVISQHTISTTLLEIKDDEANARTICSCPIVMDRGDDSTQIFFQGLWYRDRLVRISSGWRIQERIEEGYWNYNLPEGFQF